MGEQRGDRGEAPGAVEAFLRYGNVLVAGVAVAFMLGTYALLGVAPSVPLLVLGGCGTFIVYHVERLVRPAPEDALNQPARTAWAARHRGYVYGAASVALVGALAALPHLRLATLAGGALLGVLSLAYAAPLLPGGRRLKDVGMLKPAAIAAAWATGGVLLPAVEAGLTPGAGVGLLVLARFGFVLPNALLSDWPDRRGDAQAGPLTVAVLGSPAQIRRLGAAAAIGSAGAGLAGLGMLGVPLLGYVDLGGPLLMLGVVLRPWPEGRRFYAFLLDGLVAWPAVTALALWVPS